SKEHAIGALAPATFGGLSYRILDDKGGDIYIINTESFGRCAIWAPRDNDSSITASPVYSNGDTSGGGSGGGENPDGNINPFGTKIFIDPGHGGSDPGASGHGLLEKDVVLSIAKKVGDQLVKKGYNVRYSRTTDKYVELTERARLANEWGASLFVSIHANAFNGSARGTECYTHPTEVSQTKKLSTYVASSISNSLGIPNRGHKEEDFSVLRNTKMPAILVETAFIDNASDAVLLKNNQDQFANAIVKSIINNTENPEPELLKYSSNNGIFTGLGVNFIAFDRQIELGTISVIPKVKVLIATSLAATLSGPYKYIDLSLGNESVTTALENTLITSGVNYNFSKKDMKFSLQKLFATTSITDVIRYKVEIEANSITIIFETSVSHKGITIYQQILIKIERTFQNNLTTINTFVSTEEKYELVAEYRISEGLILLASCIGAGILASSGGGAIFATVGLVALFVRPKE
ncbi:MAG: N-acetylmuramoyl-L-alanine amidase family protein, partial [Cetobacterium sp.]